MTIVNSVNSNATGYIENNVPTIPADVVNKAYVDNIAAGFTFKQACICSATANFNATYNNGAAGVGATLTDNSGTFAVFTSDGQTPALNSRVLIQFQTAQLQNGIYSLTTNGDGVSQPWILTRTTDYDTPSQIVPGSIIPVLDGTLYGGTFWAEQATVVTVGTSAIVFSEFGANAALYLQKSNNLSDVNNIATSRTNLGLTNVAIQNVTQFSPLVGAAGNGITSITPMINGQLLIGATGANPVPATLTAGAGISIVNGPGTITLSSSPSGILPVASGGTGDATLTAHAVLVGEGTSPINQIGPGVAHQVLQSGGPAADPAYSAATYPATTIANEILYSSAGNTVTGLVSANRAVLVTGTTGIPVFSSSMTNGQVIIGSTAGTPVAASITAGAGIAITPGAGTLTIATSLGSPVTVPNGGTGDTTFTAHTVLVGEGAAALNSVGPGTSGQLLQSQGALADPAYTTSTYPSVVAVNSLLYASGSNAISGLAAQDNAALVSSATGQPFWTSPLTNGQIVIGASGTPPIAANLTAGANITITNAANSITIASTASGGLTWNGVTTSTAMVANNGYYVTSGAVTLTMPTTAAAGTEIAIVLAGGTSWQTAQATGQSIVYGNSPNTTGTSGYLASSQQGDTITLVCTVANTTWYCISATGTIVVN